jgi:hypothetical protein
VSAPIALTAAAATFSLDRLRHVSLREAVKPGRFVLVLGPPRAGK